MSMAQMGKSQAVIKTLFELVEGMHDYEAQGGGGGNEWYCMLYPVRDGDLEWNRPPFGLVNGGFWY